MNDQDFEGLLEAAPDAMVVIDANGRIHYVNRQTERLFGYLRDDLIGELVEVLLPERFRSRHRGLRSRFFEHPDVRAMAPGREVVARRADGSEFPAEINLGPLQTDTATLVAASVRDVTVRTRPDDPLKSLAAVAESSDDAMIVVDIDSVVTAWNTGAESAYGYSSEDIVGRSVDLIANRFRHKELPGVLARIAQGERVRPYETKGIRKDGTVLDVSIRVSPVCDAEGRMVGASIVARDISETVSFRDRLAVALHDRSRQAAELARRNHHLALINLMSELLGRTDSEAEAFEIAGRLGSRLFPDVDGAIFVRPPLASVLESVVSWGGTGSEPVFSIGDCCAVRGGRTWEWPGEKSTARCAHVLRNVVAYHCVPILDHDESIGVVTLTTTISPTLQAPFDETDEVLAETFAENLAMAMSNLRLRHTLEGRVGRGELTPSDTSTPWSTS